MTSGSQTPRRSGTSPPRTVRRTTQARLLLAGALFALIVAFALVNLHKVKVDWIVATTQTSLTIVIAVSFLLGVIGGIFLWRRHTSS